MAAKKTQKEVTRIEKKYREEVVPTLQGKFGYKNVHEIPKIEKVVLSMGIGKQVVNNGKFVESAQNDLSLIAGQKACVRRAKKAISNFKLRQGLPVGVAVTLRKDRMYEFLDRFINVALPRVRDFKGISRKAFDGRGNYSVGITEQTIFPEIDIEKTTAMGLNVAVVTSAKTNEEGLELLTAIGLPFRQ